MKWSEINIMKVLMVGDTLTQSNGVANFIMNYYRNVNQENITFEFLVATDNITNYQREIMNNGGKVYRLPKHVDEFSKFVKGYINLLFGHKDIEIVHVNLSTGISIIYGLIARLAGKKVVFHAHGEPLSKPLKFRILTPLLRVIGNQYVACSESAGKYFFGENILTNKKFTVLRNAFDPKKYSYNKLIRKKIREEFNIKNEYVIGHTGRFVPVKNHDYILDVFKKLYDDNDNCLLMLVGEGYLLSEIKKKAKELGIYNNIIFTGSRTDVDELLQAMDLFIFPSIHEGLPISLLEAQASGLPCLASDNITREVGVTDNVKYLNINIDPIIWAKEINETLKNNKRLDQSLALKNAGYDIHHEVHNLESIYNKLNTTR